MHSAFQFIKLQIDFIFLLEGRMALASLILGIAAVVLSWEGYGAFVGLACGILAIIFGNSAKKDETQNQGYAKAGRILGWISVVISIIVLVVVIGLLGLAFGLVGTAIKAAL